MSENDNKSKPDSNPDNPHKPKIVKAKKRNGCVNISSNMFKLNRAAQRIVISNRPEFNIGDTESDEGKVHVARIMNTGMTRTGVIIRGRLITPEKKDAVIIRGGIDNLVKKEIDSENKIKMAFQNARVIKVTAKSIEKHAFNGHKNLFLVHLDGVESIGDNAFGNCCHLKYLCISDSLKKIDAKVFEGCNSIIIFYSGTKEQWDKILKNNDWALGCKSIEINCKDKTITINNN